MRIHVTSFVRKGIVEQRVCVLPDSLCATCSFDTCMSVAILLKRFVSKTGSEVLRVEVQNRLTIERASSAGVAAASLQKPLSQKNVTLKKFKVVNHCQIQRQRRRFVKGVQALLLGWS